MKLPVLAFILVCVCPSFNAIAQGTDDADVFDESQFDNTIESSVQTETGNKLEILPGGDFRFAMDFSTLDEFSAYVTSGRLYGKVFMKITQPDAGFLFVSYSLAYTLFQGTNSSNTIFKDSGADLMSIEFDLSEFYIAFDIAKVVFVRVGNQLVSWGPSFFWTPGDFINLERIDPEGSIDTRTGKPLIRLHVPVAGSANVFLLADFSNTVSAAVSGTRTVFDLATTTNIALRADVTALGFEFGLTGYWGAEKPGQYGFDVAGSLFGIDVYSELGVTVENDFSEVQWGISSGFQKEFGDEKEWSLQSEFYYNSSGFDGTPDFSDPVFLAEYTRFSSGRYYLFARGGKKKLGIDQIDASVSCIVNLSDLSYSPGLTLEFDIPNGIDFMLSLQYFGGGGSKEFTFINGDKSITFLLEMSFVF